MWQLLSANISKLSVSRAKPIHLLIVALLALTWGSSFILMKRGLKDAEGVAIFSPMQVAAIRMGIASLVLLPISLPFIKSVKKSDWKWLVIVGVMGSGLPALLFAQAQSQKNMDSSVAGILNALTPLFTLIVGLLIFRRKVQNRQVVGVLIGLLGAILLISIKGFSNGSNLTSSLLITLATFFYGISVNTIASKLQHIAAIRITAISLIIAGVPYLLYLSGSDVGKVIRHHPSGKAALGYICVLGIVGSAMANALFFRLTQQTSALFAASVTYLMPIVAVFWGVWDGEKLNWMHLTCALIILAGVWLVNQKRNAPKSSMHSADMTSGSENFVLNDRK